MPCCSVKVCKNRSSEFNYKSSGITYHRFPNDPDTKEKWIIAVGRPDSWSPTKNSTVCSIHFEEYDFLSTEKARRLTPTAVPSLNLRVVMVNRNPDILSNASTSFVDTEVKTGVISKNPGKEEIVAPTDSAREKRLKQILLKHRNTIKYQKGRIKLLQTTVRRYRKRMLAMKSILDELKHHMEPTKFAKIHSNPLDVQDDDSM